MIESERHIGLDIFGNSVWSLLRLLAHVYQCIASRVQMFRVSYGCTARFGKANILIVNESA